MAEVRGGFDVLMDNIETILTDYATAQKAIDAGYDYSVLVDYYRNFNANTPGAYVFLALGAINPDQGKSAAQGFYQYTAQYFIDCVVNKPGSSGERGDEAAGARLRYLIQQVLNALHAAGKYNLDMPAGSIARRPMIQIQPLPPEMQMGERPIVGARLTMEVGLAWEPDRIEGTAIDSISVDASRWQALYEYT